MKKTHCHLAVICDLAGSNSECTPARESQSFIYIALSYLATSPELKVGTRCVSNKGPEDRAECTFL
jgi:hypothetical protein